MAPNPKEKRAASDAARLMQYLEAEREMKEGIGR
jgi:hypothetical protein